MWIGRERSRANRNSFSCIRNGYLDNSTLGFPLVNISPCPQADSRRVKHGLQLSNGDDGGLQRYNDQFGISCRHWPRSDTHEYGSLVGCKYMKRDITVLAMEKDGVRESGAQAAIYPPVRVPVRRFRQYNTHADH